MNTVLKRTLSMFIAIIMIAGLLPVSVFAVTPDLTISDYAELRQFAADVNGGKNFEGKTVVLSADISLGGEATPWTPIGTSSNPFKGTFDGGKHVISGLYINTATSYQGLFGNIATGGTVKNVTVQGDIITTGSHAAGIAGNNDGTIQNCSSSVNVTFTGSFTYYHAGIAGENGGTISGCINSGNITATTASGGIVGRNFGGMVTNCYNTGTINSVGGSHVGGVVGQSRNGASVTNCYNLGNVTGGTNTGAVVGQDQNNGCSNCYYLTGTATYGIGSLSSTSGSKTETELKAADMITTLGSAFKADTDNLNNGYPVLTWQEKVPDLIISTYEQFKSFADAVNSGNNYDGKLIRLDVNLYLGGESNPWTPIGTSSNSFKGTFDGIYHVISGLYISSGTNAGLFGYVNGGMIKNVTVQGSMTGSGSIAGVVGYLNAGIVENCGNQAAVSGTSAVGGVVGYYNGNCTISGCYNVGSVSGTTGYIGGIAGQCWGISALTDCYNVGTVSGPATVGGIAGGHKVKNTNLTNCYNAGQVVDSTGKKNNISAIVGAGRGTISNCYYLQGTGIDMIDPKNGAAEVATLSVSDLGDAFVAGGTYPELAWEGQLSTDAPVRPLFVEKTDLSKELAEYIKAAVNSAKTQNGVSGTLLGNPVYMAHASSTATDWMALAMGRFGYFDGDSYTCLIDDGTGYEDYLAAMKTYIETTYVANNGVLHSVKATEWHRAVVAIAALGGDPTNFGTYNGQPINLIADGSYNNIAGPGKQGINGWIWGLISMDTGMYDVPSGTTYNREYFIKEILKMQLTDGVGGNEYGGWVLGGYGSSSDVDITAMAIQALAPYYNDDTLYSYTNINSKKEVSKTVRQCIDEALDRLGSMMNAEAGFSSWNTNNVESISQVVVALCAVGINPAEDSRFVTNDGKTLLDGILKFRLANGGFCHVLNGSWNSMANDQATYALVSYWRLENGMRTLYDMRGNFSKATLEAISDAETAIDSIVAPTEDHYKSSLKEALAAFRAVDEGERRYVKNYSALASAIALIGGEAELDTTNPYIISIEVTKLPDKIRYYENEIFDKTGMEVTAHYSNGTTDIITDYKISSVGELILSDTTVYVTYGILKTSITIEVREKMPWDGEGTEDDPFLIKTADDLVSLRDYLAANKTKGFAGEYFKMTQDINMKNLSDWQGIAANSSVGFMGTFDGNGCSIWNLNCSIYNTIGLFGAVGNGAVIKNVTIASGNLGGIYAINVGAIAGKVMSGATVTIENCHNYADLKGLWGIGGIIGHIGASGVAGEGVYAIIKNCSNYGTISASYTGGGIVGQVGENRLKNDGSRLALKNCYNAGEIKGNGSWGNGGLIGAIRPCGTSVTSTIKNSYNAGTVSGTSVGSVVGSICETVLELENVYYLDSSCATVHGTFNDDGDDIFGTINGNAVANTSEEMKAEGFVSLLGDAFEIDGDSINSGYPILKEQNALGEEAPAKAGLEISTAKELKEFADRVNSGENFKDKTVALTAHIDLSNITWVPIGRTSALQFQGIFDGQGYVIDNLYSTAGGLFGYVGHNAIIKNVGVASGEIGASNESFIGAIAGWSNGADIINCWNGADIYCSGYSGGIVGTVRDGGKSSIVGCYNIGKIYATSDSVGGIVGHLDTTRTQAGTEVEVTIDSCYNLGAIISNTDNAIGAAVGGIVGRAQDGHKIRNSYNAGEITVANTSGGYGIIGSVTSDNVIENCYFDSSVTAEGSGDGEGVVGKTALEMSADAFAALLGELFKVDKYALVNSGYPILTWQSTEDADDIDTVIAAIDAIGTVTLSSDAINAARNAYDNLDEALQGLVTNLSILTDAEQALANMQTLKQAKETAIAQLETYKNLNDYRQAQKEELALLIENGKAAINSAENTDAVVDALAKTKVEMDKVKTDAQLTEEENQPLVPPQTGDNSNIVLYILIIALSLSAIIVLTAKKKKVF